MRLLLVLFGVCFLTGCSDKTSLKTVQPQSEAGLNIIKTTTGELRGSVSEFDQDIRVFKGIPYAAPPVGDLRWKPPQSPIPWQGVRESDQPGASCIQPINSSGFVWKRGDFEISEDCLYLNIWSTADAENLPVMVWFHGGSHTSGQGHARIFDGTTLAQQKVVLVTINYRLGPFGFLAHPWLADESEHGSAGNYGLLDKIAALKWVRDNVAQFGGNPENVTIFGQSAGSQSVCSLMASPLSRGLFHKAIGQSAACVGSLAAHDASGQERGSELVESLNAESLSELRSKPADEIMQAADGTGWASTSRIVIDGWVLPKGQREIYREGSQAQVPLMLGSLSDEGFNLFPVNESLTDAELDTFLGGMVAGDAAELKKFYSASSNTPGAIQHAIATDLFMTFGMRRWAEYNQRSGNETYLYYMDHVPPAFHLYMPEDPVLDLPGGPRSAGAYHSGDLALVFGNIHRVGLHWNQDDEIVSQMLVQYWANFARHGNPNGQGLPDWQPFDASTYKTLRINKSPGMVDGVKREALDIMGSAQPM